MPLVLHRDGEAVLVLGNENLKLAGHTRKPSVIHARGFRRPISRMETCKTLAQRLQEQGVAAENRNWPGRKLFILARRMIARRLFDLPAFIVDVLFARPPARRQD